MSKHFLSYGTIWAILLALFNIVCFVSPSTAGEMSKYAGAFWAGYIFITIAFVGQLICGYFAFKADNLQKLFNNISLITISYTGLIVMIIVGALCMAIPNLPNWFGSIVCYLILAFNLISVLKATVAIDAVSKIDEKIKTKTEFIKLLTVDAQNLLNRASSNTAKAECKKVYEALRYSDPMSNDALAGIESQITLKFNEFSTTVTSGAENITVLADELVVLIGDRNKKCKLVK